MTTTSSAGPTGASASAATLSDSNPASTSRAETAVELVPKAATSPLLSASSSTSAHSNPFLRAASDNAEATMTPPLSNGQTRPHPLLDEHQVSDSEQQSEERPKGASNAAVDALALDAGSQFPSPSSGFVPPVTEQDFTLSSVPAVAKVKQASGEAGGTETTLTNTVAPGVREAAQGQANPLESAVQGSATIPRQNTAVASSSSSSKSSSSQSDNHSQAISARSSPSTVAPQRRASSFSPLDGSTAHHLEGGDEEGLQKLMIPLKIRDYAFLELDPRHVGARDVSAPSPSADRYDAYRSGTGGWRRGTEDDDAEEGDHDDEEDEDGEEANVEQRLPTGLYHAAYDFVGESEHELSVAVGQKVRLIGHVDGGWAIVVRVEEGEEDRKFSLEEEMPGVDKGLVPEAYLEWLG